MVADSYGQWQGFANQQDQIAASNYFASIQAAQRARQIAAEEEARRYNAWVESQRYAQNQALLQDQEAERRREWTAEYGLKKSTGEKNLGLTEKYYDWQMTKPDERAAAVKDHAMSVALNMVQQGFTPDIAAQATGLDETSYERTAPVYNFIAKQSKEEADQADALAKSLNEAKKIVDEAESLRIDQTSGKKVDSARLQIVTQRALGAQKLIQQYGTNPRWSGWVAFDEDVNRYIPRKKALPEFKWKTGGGQVGTSESNTAETPANYEPEITPADMGVAQALMPQIRRPVFLGPYVPAAMVRNNDAMAAQYANQLLIQYPGMTRDQAKVEARKLYP